MGMNQQVAAQPSNGPTPSVFPEGSGLFIAGSTARGTYKIAQSENMNKRMTHLQTRIPFPLDKAVCLPGSHRDSKRQGDYLRRLFSEKRSVGRWFNLSVADLAQARAYLTEEKERLAREVECARQEAVRAQQQAAKARENAIDECFQLINRVRMLTEVVRSSVAQECRVARYTWPEQQMTDQCLQLVDRFHAAAGKFDAAFSRAALEIQLGRMPKDDAALSAI